MDSKAGMLIHRQHIWVIQSIRVIPVMNSHQDEMLNHFNSLLSRNENFHFLPWFVIENTRKSIGMLKTKSSCYHSLSNWNQHQKQDSSTKKFCYPPLLIDGCCYKQHYRPLLSMTWGCHLCLVPKRKWLRWRERVSSPLVK